MLRMIVIILGIVLLCLDFLAYAYKKITEGAGLAWGLFSVVVILVGAIPALAKWSNIADGDNYIAIFLIWTFFVLGLFFLTITVSQLQMKNQELAMQVSLLNQENEKILDVLQELKEKEIIK